MVGNIFLQMDYKSKIVYYLYKLRNNFQFVGAPLEFIHGNLRKCQKKVLKIHSQWTVALLQSRLINMDYQNESLMETVYYKKVCLFFIEM